MTAVVTGASGHVGGNLVRGLLARGRTVRCLVRDDVQVLEGLDVEQVKADVRDRDSLVKAFAGADTVFHLAALISIAGEMGGLVQDTNVKGVANVVSACLECGVKRLVHFASIHAFEQAPLDEPLNETRTRVGDDGLAYDRSKAGGIAEVLKGVEQGLNATIVCPTAVLGPNDFKPSRMGLVFLKLQHRKLLGLIEGGFDWVDVRDIVAGALAAEEKGRTGEIYLLSGHYATVVELGKLAEDVTTVAPPKMVTPMWLGRSVAPFAEAWASLTKSEPLFTAESLAALRANKTIENDKARRELGYVSRPLLETVKEVYRSFEERGLLKKGG